MTKLFYYYVVPLFLIFFISFSRHAFADFVYTTNAGLVGDVSVLDATTLNPIAGSPFPTGGVNPEGIGIAINPAGTRIYIPNSYFAIPGNTLSVLDAHTLIPIPGSPFMTGGTLPYAIAINSAGTRVYVTNFNSETVVALDATTLAIVAGPQTPGGTNPSAIAVSPDGTRVYVTFNTVPYSVYMLDGTTLMNLSGPVATGATPNGIVATETRVYITNFNSNSVSVFDADLNQIPGSPFTAGIGTNPYGIAISPDGARIYIANYGSNNVSVLDAGTLAPIGLSPYSSGGVRPIGIALNSEGTFVYTANSMTRDISVLDTSTFSPIAGSPFTAGSVNNPSGIVLTPSPQASMPPSNLTGHQKKNDFGVVFELFNLLQWEAPASPASVVGYYVYRDGAKIATLDNSTFEYKDHNRKKGVTTLYSVTSFAANSDESAPINISVK